MTSPSRWQRVALVLALCFVAGVVGWWINEPARESFNEVDAGFLSDMTLHHSGAIGLSFAYLGQEHDTLVGHFAREIVVAQSQEVVLMNQMLRDAGRARSDDDGNELVMGWMGMPVRSSDMPGMANAEELAQLGVSIGLAADDLFTRLMIRHHASGMAMADYAERRGENGRVRRLAAGMAHIQRLEINEMNARRAALGLARVDPATLAPDHQTHRPEK